MLGFTLIELLIALVVFSIMVGLAAYTFRFYIGIAKRVLTPYPEEAVAFANLREAINNVFYYICNRKGLASKDDYFVYFYGSEREVKFVTSRTILGNFCSLCRLYEKNNALMLDASPIYSPENNYLSPMLKNPKRITLITGIKNLRIEYYKKGTLLPEEIKEQIPSLIAIHFIKDGKERSIYCSVKSDFENKGKITSGVDILF